MTTPTTKRVTGAIATSKTQRIPSIIIPIGPFLLLEGDSSGVLLLGNPDIDGFMKLQGTF